MKKRVFFLLLAAIVMPFAMQAQQNSSAQIIQSENACVSYTWSVTGVTYTESGAYTAYSGDTLYVLDLTINPTYNIVVPTPIHGGCSFTWGGMTYTDEGVKQHTFTSSQNCDSTVTITLTLDTVAYADYTVTACGEYTWKGQTLTTTGNYDTIDSGSGQCDSILTLSLTIIEPRQSSSDTTFSGCDRVSVPGYSRPFRENTTLTNEFHSRTAEQCYDSVARIHVVVKTPMYHTETVRACDEYSVTVGSTEHTYTYSIHDTIKAPKASNGCDSNFVLHLTINKSPEITIDGDLRIAPGSDATLTAHSNQTVNYKWHNNSTSESITLTHVTGNVDVYVTGTNSATGCYHTSYATVMANVGIDEVDSELLTVYPNPTSAMLNVKSSEAVKSIVVFSTTGQQVMRLAGEQQVDLSSLANGTYVVRVELANGTVGTRTVILSK